ncbi:MAG: cytochrome b [Dokdonella sp.]|uniref:cytochrome b n=1 Tax=Dokdonella sp. TaxID=2291710 RepID=UPI00326350FF
MNFKNTALRYGSVSIAMHWLMVALMVGVYACIELREFFPKGSDLRESLKTWHFMLGLGIFLLVFARLAFRTGPRPSITPPIPRWQHFVSVLMHLALYVFMIVMPLLGWLTLSAEGHPIPFFGLHLPALVNADPSIAEWADELHETIGVTGYYLIGLHAAAALVHHYFMRDNTLMRMWPRLTRARRGR